MCVVNPRPAFLDFRKVWQAVGVPLPKKKKNVKGRYPTWGHRHFVFNLVVVLQVNVE